MPIDPGQVAGELAIEAMGLEALLDGSARWTRAAAEDAAAAPFRYRQAIRRVMLGEPVDEPDAPRLPKVIPPTAPIVPEAPTETSEAMVAVLAALMQLDATDASDTPLGPIPHDRSILEEYRRRVLWRTLSRPMSVLADASRGRLSYAQLDVMRAALPGTLALWQTLMGAALAKAPLKMATPQVRLAVAMLVQGQPWSEPVTGMPTQVPGAPPGPAPRRPAARGGGGGEASAAQEVEAS